MIQSSLKHHTRRVSASAGSQTDGNTGRKRLAGSTPYPPSSFDQAQKKLGRTIQALRQQIGLSHQQLGADCGITIAKLKQIEAGKVDADLPAIIRLAQRLGATLESLLTGIE